MLRRDQKRTFDLSKNAPKKSIAHKNDFSVTFWQNSFLDKTILGALFIKIKFTFSKSV